MIETIEDIKKHMAKAIYQDDRCYLVSVYLGTIITRPYKSPGRFPQAMIETSIPQGYFKNGQLIPYPEKKQ